MRAPAFWTRPTPSFTARLLAPVGAIYGSVTARRMARAGVSAGVPVICVGNVTAGGTGKTPTALLLAERLAASGRAPAFLTRGYGGRLPGPVLVHDGHTAAEVGDEALLLAARAPTIVSRDRPAGAALAVASGADTIVMDDGLQNPSLLKQLSLAVFDAATGQGNGLCVPAGPLRAPLPAHWPHLHAVVLIGKGAPGDTVAREAEKFGKPVLRAALEPVQAERFAGRRVLAFAGIGRPGKFFSTLREVGAEVISAAPFADHAPLTAAQAGALLAQSLRENCALVTTEKDACRLRDRADLADFTARVEVLRVAVRVADEAALDAMLAALSFAPDQRTTPFSGLAGSHS